MVHSRDRDPLYGTVPGVAILENQARLPWWTPTGLPPGYKPPEPDEDGVTTTESGLPGYDDAEPIWVGVPPIVQEIIDAEGDRAAERAADWERARLEDEAGISGHNVMLQEKLAFGLATWDGEWNIAMEHWDAAGLLLEMRQLVYDASVIEAKIERGKVKHGEGHDRGVVQSAARAAEAETTDRVLRSTCDRILNLIDAAREEPTAAKVRKAVLKGNPRLFGAAGTVNTAYLAASLSAPQRGYAGAALGHLRSQGLITDGTEVQRRAATAPLSVVPPIGSSTPAA
ncbi:hypothetical protein [Tsukamurella soli]|uniref:hypothetical protein n=1 Tax=Tsukamurella soli TaxID=644556 RepID=UPI003622B4F7